MEKYVEQLSPQEKVALEIARKILGPSFNLEKSIGYLEFKKKNTPLS
jgi:hypothetical protein